MMKDYINGDMGTVEISEDVISIIAGVAAMEVNGVSAMSGGFTGSLTEMLGMKNLSKGVKVELEDNRAIIDVYIVVDYGKNLREIGEAVQKSIKEAIETMTDLIVEAINVNVHGINFSKTKDKKDLETN